MNVQRTVLCGLLTSSGLAAWAQVDSAALKYAATINEDDLRRHLMVIASDEYEGRETGYEGQRMAARYLKEAFSASGIGPVPGPEGSRLVDGYEQEFPLELVHPGQLGITISGLPYGFAKDYFYFNDRLAQKVTINEVMLSGYGLSYEGVDATDRTILVLEGDGDQHTPDDFYQQMAEKAKAAEKAGARILLIASSTVPDQLQELGHYLTGSRMRLVEDDRKVVDLHKLQTIVISRQMAERLFQRQHLNWNRMKKLAKRPPRVLQTELLFTHEDRSERMSASNVLGYIEGTDKKDELILLTAHYDHIGAHDGDVYNGADDDGSGTVALLEIAEAFARAKRDGHGPRRSILLMPVSGEEKGLLGSEWYSEHPVFPLDHTVADLNIDMIGREDSAHAGKAPYVYIIGSDRLSTDLHKMNEEANRLYTGLELDQTFNSADDPNRFYYRSDHYNFAKHGVPVIFYFSGVHEDYHRPGDEVQKIRFDLLRQRAALVFHTAWMLANREDRIIVDGRPE